MAAQTKSVSRIVTIAGGLALLGGGAVYTKRASTVAVLEREQADVETKVFVAQAKLRRAETQTLETESLIKALKQQIDLDTKASHEIGQQLDAARLQVQQLEVQQAQKDEDIQRSSREVLSAQQALEVVRKDSGTFKGDAASAEKELSRLKQQVAEARRQLNPVYWVRSK